MALQIRKLPPEESARLFPKRGQMDLSEYVDALRGLQPGDAAEVKLSGLTTRAVKRRVGQAAKELGYTLRWVKEPSDGALQFQVREAGTSRPRNGRRRRRRAE